MHTEVASALIDVEAALRRMGLWQAAAPDAAALASQQPFAVDTLSFPQWLQFIFLPRMYLLIEHGDPLPGQCGIAPMAEEYFRGSKLPVSPLLDALGEVDALLSGDSLNYSTP